MVPMLLMASVYNRGIRICSLDHFYYRTIERKRPQIEHDERGHGGEKIEATTYLLHTDISSHREQKS